MKLFLISDTHFGISSNSMEWLDVQRSFFFDWFIDDIKSRIEEGDQLFHLGDVFDSRQSLHLKVLNFGLDVFTELSKIIPVNIILGNHDCHNTDSNDVNSVRPLGNINNVKVYSEPEVIHLRGKRILLMPWRQNHAKESECLLENEHADYLFCHADVKGASFNKWTKVEHGCELSSFKSYKKVYSGHIHHRHKIGNVSFVGCPYPLTRSDMHNTKGYWIIDLDNDTEEFIENTISPRFIQIGLRELLNMSLSEARDYLSNNIVDVCLKQDDAIDFSFQDLDDLLSGSYRKLTYKIDKDQHDNLTKDDVKYDVSLYNICDFADDAIDSLTYSNGIKTKMKDFFRSLMKSVSDT